MKYTEATTDVVTSPHEARRDAARAMILDIFDRGIDCAKIEDDKGEYKSLSSMRQIFHEEARRAARNIIKQRGVRYNIDIEWNLFSVTTRKGSLYLFVNRKVLEGVGKDEQKV